MLPAGYTEMERINPLSIILMGFVMVLFGAVVPFLTVLDIIEASFFWLFLAFASSIGGLILGIIGAAYYTRLHRK